MTRSKKLSPLEMYEYGGVAEQLAKSPQTSHLVGKSLEKLAVALGLGDAARGFVAGAVETEEGRKKATELYNQDYQEILAETTMGDLLVHYKGTGLFEGYFTKDELNMVEGDFNRYKDKILGKINLEIEVAKHKAKGYELGENSLEEAEAAAKDVAKYDSVMKLYSILENMNMSRLILGVKEEASADVIKQVLKQGRQIN